MAKINIISGFLGAGKTTFIKKLLKEVYTDEKVVLIENEFGEIGIDGGFLKEAGIQITEMNSGCICCSLVGDFGNALREVVTKFQPDRILIEPSGVGKLSDVIRAVQDVSKEIPVEAESSITVADALKCKMYMKNFGEFYNNQIKHADTIILSRTQKIQQDKLESCVELIRELNKQAAVITTPWDDLGGRQIQEAIFKKNSIMDTLLLEEVCPECGQPHLHHHDKEESQEQNHSKEGCCKHGHHHSRHEESCCGQKHHHNHYEEGCCEQEHHHNHEHHHHADEVFTSWGMETAHKFSTEELRQILEHMADSDEYGVILRAKGMIPNENGEWMYFDLVPGEYEIRTGNADYTGRVCVIGTKLDENKIKHRFHAV